MIKIIRLFMFSIIMMVEVIATSIVYLLGLGILMFEHLVGTKLFMVKFRKLNKEIINDINGTIKDYKQIVVRV